jgi:AcrR family transcriptional regulator
MERADAARNRQAILRATEELLDQHGPDHISLDRVAATAGVGKGTVFRRFGSRTGLFQELLAERATRIREAIDHGPPPLGPTAPPRDRLVSFLTELAALATQNIALFAAHEQACAANKHQDPTYAHWHTHLTNLIHQLHPTADAEFLAHTLLSTFDGDLVRHLTTQGGLPHLQSSIQSLTTALIPNSSVATKKDG